MLLACLFLSCDSILSFTVFVYVSSLTHWGFFFLFKRIFFNVLGGGGVGITECHVCWGLPPKI